MICYTINEHQEIAMSKRRNTGVPLNFEIEGRRVYSDSVLYYKSDGTRADACGVGIERYNKKVIDNVTWSDPAEPNLGQMFDMAYEDQCAAACGL